MAWTRSQLKTGDARGTDWECVASLPPLHVCCCSVRLIGGKPESFCSRWVFRPKLDEAIQDPGSDPEVTMQNRQQAEILIYHEWPARCCGQLPAA